MELIKDYNCIIDYDLGRENFVIDALSCKNKVDDTHGIIVMKKNYWS